MITRFLRLGLVALALAAAGCAVSPTPNIDKFAARSSANSFEIVHRGVGSSALVLPVVQDRQTSGASCGVHALASIINYWRPGSVTGDALYLASPPAEPRIGYSLAELMALAEAHDLVASGVRLDQAGLVRELEAGRPVLIPGRVPAIYLGARNFPGVNTPGVGAVSNSMVSQVGRVSEWMGHGLVSHYLVVAGYQGHRFVVVEPILGYRTISFEKLARYRRPFGNAAIVFSAQAPAPADLRPAPPGPVASAQPLFSTSYLGMSARSVS